MRRNPTADDETGGKRDGEPGGKPGGTPDGEPVQIVALGGCGQFGLNCTCVQCGTDLLVLDCGLMLPADDMPGVDMVLPDLSYLAVNRKRIRAYIVTHGHDDHIGGIPFALETAPAPVYGTPFTLGLLEQRLAEHVVPVQADLRLLHPKSPVEIGSCFTVEAVSVAHSVPDAVAVSVQTPRGGLFFSGDFKMHGSGNGVDQPTDERRLAEIGEMGVKVLLSDSTNALIAGSAGTEDVVMRSLSQIFATSPGRIFVAVFSTHVARIQTICALCQRFNRKIAFDGRSLSNVIELAEDLKYLHIPTPLRVDPKRAQKVPRRKLTVMLTGSQGEARSALARLATQDHAHLKLDPGDTVVLSARVIPGRERSVDRMVDRLCRLGAVVVDSRYADAVHVSGHGQREDLAQLVHLLKPRTVMPIHGRYRMQIEHANIARQQGTDQVVIPNNGSVLEVQAGGLVHRDRAPAGQLLVDGKGVGDVGLPVLRARRALANTGMVVAVVLLDVEKRSLARPLELISRGFVTEGDQRALMTAAREAIEQELEGLGDIARGDANEVAEAIRTRLRRYFRRQLNRAPVVIPLVLEI